jgi:hypothetical protein
MKTQAIVLSNDHVTAKNVVMGDQPGPIVTIDPTVRNVYLIGERVEFPVGAAIYPIAGHVRAPDTYGPTGADYTGTEVLPDIADVKLGVDYGANGTEFTGTYAGGGGGATRPIGSPVVRRKRE